MNSNRPIRFAAALGLGVASLAAVGEAAPVSLAPRRGTAVTPGFVAAHQATLGPSLQARLATLDAVTPTVVIVTFNSTDNTLNGVSGLTALLGQLSLQGIVPATRFEAVGMISMLLTKSQIASLATQPSVRSIWANDALYGSLHQARVLCGVDKMRANPALTGGRIIDGGGAGANAGKITVAVIDSGIDTRNPDLDFDFLTSATGTIPNTKVIQNVQFTTTNMGVTSFVEHVQNDDSVGHGSHCSGIVGGSGAFSLTTPSTTGPGGTPLPAGTVTGPTEDFSGVAGRYASTSLTDFRTAARGVHIVGLGSGAGLFILDAVGGFNYAVTNRVKYNIRVTSNSYGSIGAFTPDDPLNVLIKSAYDAGITNVFAAGNSGPGVDTLSASSKSPYVISVAAGTKEGGLASFSSRGIAASERAVQTTDPATGLPTKDANGNVYNANLFNVNAITAPGTGREFAFNAPGVADAANKGFYSNMISTRSAIGGTAAGMDDQEFPAPYQSNYTAISGTSMACPFIAGTCALLLDADPTLTPAAIKSILQATATHTPGYDDFESGAGYVNVLAAVDKALNPLKPYQPFTFNESDFSVPITRTLLAPPPRPGGFPPTAPDAGSSAAAGEKFSLPYNPNATPVAAATYDEAVIKAQQPADANGRPSSNALAFTVGPDATGKKPTILDIRVKFGQDVNSIAGQLGGNSLGLLLWAPDGTSYSSGIALPVLDDPSRQVVVKNPVAGLWVVELRGLRGLAAVPVTPPTGVGLPEVTNGQILRTNLTIQDPGDIAEVAQRDAIRFALANRYLDAYPDPARPGQTVFNPSAKVTRQDFVTALALNTPLRQSLASASPRFTDVSATLSRFAEAASQNGSTLRDFDFTPAPTLPVSASPQLSPNAALSRGQAAVALVRALGLDGEARNLRNLPTVTAAYVDNAGVTQRIAVSDIPAYNPGEPGANTENGYLQLAINRGLLPVTAVVRPGRPVVLTATPTKPLVRADLAILANNFRRIFSLGNSLDATANETLP